MSDTLDLAMKLLACPSITPEDANCQSLIAAELEASGFEVTDFPVNNVKNLWARYGKAQPLFCFAGHTDVVPTGDLNAWESPPFTPTIRNAKLYARGAADMKSSVAAMVTAAKRFIQQYPHFSGSIAFLITSDEEGMAIDGTKAALKELEKREEIPSYCLVGEASSAEKLGDTIRVGRRGSITGTLKIIGKQGHVAFPDFAKNPIHLALEPLKAIVDFQWDNGNAFFPPSSLQFSNIHAGTGADNVIPGTLEAVFNVRFSPLSSPELIQQTISEILDQYYCHYDLKWRLSGKPFYTSPSSKLVQTVINTIQKELGYTPISSTGGGTSDGRFFAEYGCEVVELGPQNATVHQVNECISIEELEGLSRLYEKILAAFFVPHSP